MRAHDKRSHIEWRHGVRDLGVHQRPSAEDDAIETIPLTEEEYRAEPEPDDAPVHHTPRVRRTRRK